MNDPLWTRDFNILLKKDRLSEFWPSKTFTTTENVNSISRFCLYSGVILTILKKDPFYLLISIALIIIVSKMYERKDHVIHNNPIQPAHNNPDINIMTNKKCVIPTKDNPFANVNYFQDLNRPSACTADEVKEEINEKFFDNFEKNPYDIYNNKHSQRQFFSVSSTTVPNDQKSFATWLYGGANKKKCKENTNVCTGNEAYGSG